MIEALLLEIISSLLVVVGGYFAGKYALESQYKKEVAKDIFAYRYQLIESSNTQPNTNELYRSLNAIKLVYGKDKKVTALLNKFHNATRDISKYPVNSQEYINAQKSSDALLCELIEQVGVSSGLLDKKADNRVNEVFSPK